MHGHAESMALLNELRSACRYPELIAWGVAAAAKED